MAVDVYQTVTDRILELLDKGTVPWRTPIQTNGNGWPKNLESNKAYRGINVFLSREFYYATAFHELAHATGHTTRLARGIDTNLAPFGSADYSREELVAEMGSAFLCATADISPPTIEQAAAYIAGWRKKLTDDPKLIVGAAGAGQRAADWILGSRLEQPQ